MKLSVIFGVIHMTIGVLVKGSNSMYFSRNLDFFFEVITGIIILLGLFGWMDILIFAKWNYVMQPYSIDQTMIDTITQAPSIITVMINNFLAGGYPGGKPDPNAVPPIPQPYFIPGQRGISELLVVIVLICVPLMLCVKPCALIYCCNPHKDHAHGAEFQNVEPVGEDGQPLAGNDNHGGDEKADIRAYEDLLNQEGGDHGAHGAGEIFIHQMIETIEFVLGTVSNTASYLRLWALSLAHSQLAAVFLENGLKMAWTSGKYGPHPSSTTVIILSFLFWFAFMSATFGILMCMDVLECFLHTLRLHWVEFQNKFYKGGGYLYIPFSFKAVFEKEKARA
jgi:V-type H+-transporting ATPase subunit a